MLPQLYQQNKYETDSYFLHFFQSNTTVIRAFCRRCEHEIVCHFKNQNKNNFTYTNLTKGVNYQTNCCIASEMLKKIWIGLIIIQLYYLPRFEVFQKSHGKSGRNDSTRRILTLPKVARKKHYSSRQHIKVGLSKKSFFFHSTFWPMQTIV